MNGPVGVFQVLTLLFMRSRRQQLLFSLVVATITATAAGSALFPVLFSLGIDALGTGGSARWTGIDYIIAFGLGLIVVGILEQLQWLTFGPMNLRLQRHLTTHVFSHVLALPHYRLKSFTTYEIGRAVERGLDAVREITSNLTFFLLPTAIELAIAASVMAFMIDVWIALLLLLALVAYGILANISAERIRRSTEHAMERGAEAWSFGLDGVANAELVQQANFGQVFRERLNDKLKVNDRAWSVTFRQRTWFGVLQALVFGLVVLGVLWRGSAQVGAGALSIGELVLLNTYIIRLLQPVETFARVYRDVHASAGEARLLMDLLALPGPNLASALDFDVDRPYALELRGVALRIEDRFVFEDVTFIASAARRLFIVGPSGAGKSSLLKVLSCLAIADEGEYRINGVTVSDATAAHFRTRVAVVQQDCLLFDWSIAENVAFGSNASSGEVESILQRLGLDEVARRHRELGHPTVGERGNRLSGGEKQRLSMARALLAKPRLLLLDEPTAALDEGNRKRVLEAIADLQDGCTCVFVTHDLSLLDDDANVLFLTPDRSIGLGTHAELRGRDADYARFLEGAMHA